MEGIKETRELAQFIVLMVNGIHRSLKDGSVNWKDAFHLAPAGFALPRALQGIEKLPGEIKDLTDEERAELWEFLFRELEAGTIQQKELAMQLFNAQSRAIQLALALFQAKNGQPISL